MKVLLEDSLIQIDKYEMPKVLRTLKSKGYYWKKGDIVGGHKSLWTPDGGKCIGERYRGYLYLDGDLLEIVRDILYGKAS